MNIKEEAADCSDETQLKHPRNRRSGEKDRLENGKNRRGFEKQVVATDDFVDTKKFRKTFHDEQQQHIVALTHDGHGHDGLNTSSIAFRELKEYLSSLVSTLQEQQLSEDDQETMFNNCIEEIRGHEVQLYYRSSAVSRYLETLFCMPAASNAVYSFFEATVNLESKQLLDIALNTSGSHLLETVLHEIALRFIYCDKTATDEPKTTEESALKATDASKMLEKFIVEFLVEAVEHLMFDKYGSHVLRTVGRVITGQATRNRSDDNSNAIPANQKASAESASQKICGNFAVVPENLQNCFRLLAEKVLDWSCVHEFLSHESVSLVVQDYISCDYVSGSGFLSLLLKNCYSVENFALIIAAMWSHTQASRVWEKIVVCCTEKQRRKLIKFVLNKEQCTLLAQDKSANFVIQRLLDSAETEKTANKLLKIVVPTIPTIVSRCSTFGVLVALVSMCGRLHFKETELFETLTEVFVPMADKKHDNGFELLRCFLRFGAKDTADKNKGGNQLEITYFGSLIVQKLLEFSEPTAIVEAILNLPVGELQSLVCHQYGSFIVTMFLKQPTVLLQSKTRLLQALKGRWSQIACNKYGSRVVDQVWIDCPVKDRLFVAGEMAPEFRALSRDRFGKFTVTKWGLYSFHQDQNRWLQNLKRNEKQKKMFSELLPSL